MQDDDMAGSAILDIYIAPVGTEHFPATQPDGAWQRIGYGRVRVTYDDSTPGTITALTDALVNAAIVGASAPETFALVCWDATALCARLYCKEVYVTRFDGTVGWVKAGGNVVFQPVLPGMDLAIARPFPPAFTLY